MFLQDWWYTTLLGTEEPIQPPLERDIDANVVVVGAGMAGLSACLRLADGNRRVVLLEKNICGGSSTGKSAGFLTPSSELDLSQIVKRFGKEGARHLWEVPEKGIELIVKTARENGIDCDLQKQDSVFVSNDGAGVREVRGEAEARRELGYPVTSYTAQEIPNILGSSGFRSAIRYSDTYGIDALRYSQGVKRALLGRGVRIFESTEAVKLDGHTVRTRGGSVKAEKIIICADKLQPSFTRYAENVFHAQTFLTISEPLTDRDVAKIFPAGPVQCWDSDLIYNYWRLTGDQRLLLGGGSVLSTYALRAVTSPRVADHVIKKFKKKFPALQNLEFRQYWPGLIDVTRDLFPTVLRDPRSPWVHFVLGCVGLPWAAFCGDFAARHALDTDAQSDHIYYQYFRPDRKFLLPLWTERIVGKPIAFCLNNVWAEYY